MEEDKARMAELRAMVAELREQKKKLLELRAMMAELVEQQKKESFLTKVIITTLLLHTYSCY